MTSLDNSMDRSVRLGSARATISCSFCRTIEVAQIVDVQEDGDEDIGFYVLYRYCEGITFQGTEIKRSFSGHG